MEPERALAALARAREAAPPAASEGGWLPAALVSARPAVALESLVELWPAAAACLGDAAERALPGLVRLLGSSDFLGRRLRQQPEEAAIFAETPASPPEAAAPRPDWSAIRQHKYAGLLRIAARDQAGRAFESSLRELSDLADRCLDAALRCSENETGVPAPACLALGKLGGRELNFSSDVDLLFVYQADAGVPDLERNQAVARHVRHFKRELESPSGEGFGYRVDLDLRPEGPSGVLANSVDAALDYYEIFGAEWERQALIRLRPIAGEPDTAARLVRESLPFIYRRSIDPQVLRNVGDMKARIERERSAAGRDLAFELKEGPGGIRDVEFLVQALQLLYGGRELGVRTGNVLDATSALRDTGVLPPETAESLRDAYLWLRRAEHALQLEGERQLHRMPADPAAQRAQARRMGYDQASAEAARTLMLDDWTRVRAQVRAHFESLVLEASLAAP